MRVVEQSFHTRVGVRLLYVALCTAPSFAVCSDVVAAPDRVAPQVRGGYVHERLSPDDIRLIDTTVVHACPNAKVMTLRRPVGFDGRRIRPID